MSDNFGMTSLQKFGKVPTPDTRISKTLILSMNVDQNWSETEFSIAICRQSGRQMAIENTNSSGFFGVFFYPRSSIVKSVVPAQAAEKESTALLHHDPYLAGENKFIQFQG